MPTSGTRGQPQYSRADPTRVAQYLTDVSDWAAIHGGRMAGLASERTVLNETDLWDGLEFYEQDTKDLYRYIDGWHLWERSRTGFAPTWTGFVLGNGEQNASYSITAGRDLHIEFAIQFGSTSRMQSSPTMTMPDGITLITNTGAFRFPLGWALFKNDSDDVNGDRYGVATIVSTNQVTFRPLSQGATYLGVDAPGPTIPHTWGTNDEFMGNFHSFIAIQ